MAPDGPAGPSSRGSHLASTPSTTFGTARRRGPRHADPCLLLARRFVAIALGVALTGYSAWVSWHHTHDVLGPLAAVSAAILLALCEYAWRDRQWIRFGLLGLLGIAAAVISGSVVLERVSATSERATHAKRSDNLPRAEAQAALAEAQKALSKAEASTTAECSSGRGPRCTGLEKREDEARKRVEDARSKVTGLGAQTAENPAASLLGPWAATFQLAMLLGLPVWLELAAPVVLVYGFAPLPSREEAPKRKAKRRKKKRHPRPPPAQPSAKVLPLKKAVP